MIRMSDLLDCEVYDHDGNELGKVRNVRLVQDGPLRGTQALLRVDALVVGGSALAGRLGYLRGGAQGPWLLAAIMGRLERRALTIAAGDIEEWDDVNHRLRLAAGAAHR